MLFGVFVIFFFLDRVTGRVYSSMLHTRCTIIICGKWLLVIPELNSE